MTETTTQQTPLIDQLTCDLCPVAPLCPYATFIRLGLLALLGGAAMISFEGLRPDVGEALGHVIPFWKSGIFALIGVGALLTLCRLGVPGRGTGVVGPTLMTFGTAGLVAFVLAAFAYAPDLETFLHGLYLSDITDCLASVIFLGGVLLMAGGAILRRFAFTRPHLAGWLLGTASGTLAAAAYAWHCINDEPLYVGVWYSLPVLVLGVLGLAAGGRLFRL